MQIECGRYRCRFRNTVRSFPLPVPQHLVTSAVPPKEYGELLRSPDSLSNWVEYSRVTIKGRLRRVELQRLFSTFPSGWPGIGLLLLRAMVGFILIAHGLAYLKNWPDSAPVTLAVGALAFATGFCLLGGFLTPIAGVLVGIGGLGFAFSSSALPALDLVDSKLVIVNVIVISIAIALLGPGAFSLDALMFGRREISIPQSVRSSKPK